MINFLSIEAACGCNIGLRRENNEDNFYFGGEILPIDNRGMKKILTLKNQGSKELLCGVFDGMGGEEFGEEASFAAAKTAKENACDKESEGYPEIYLEKLILKMNEEVCVSRRRLGVNHIGSTAVVFYRKNDEFYVGNIGDSRAFCIRGREMFQLSRDHTDEILLQSNGITNRKPVLTQYLGILPEEMLIEPYVVREELRAGDCYLLCSDGLTDMVSVEEINGIISTEKNAKNCVEQLINKALEHGGIDNITAIVIKVK